MKTNLNIKFWALILYVQVGTTLSGMSNGVNFQDTSDLDISAIWYTSVFQNGGDDHPECRQEMSLISVQREEQIGGRMSQIIGVTEGGMYYPESELPLYRENKKLFFYEDNTWKLLYDFSAIAGDTVNYYLSKKANYYLRPYGVIPEIDFIIPDTCFSLVVNKVDTIITKSGLSVKRFMCTDLTYRICHKMDIIYENIGSLFGLFGEIGCWITPECITFPAGLQCYAESGQTFSFVNHDCSILNGTDDLGKKENFELRPNPTNGLLTIVGLQEAVTVNIFDLHGVLHKSMKSVQSSIDISELPLGMYLVQIEFDTIRKTLKLIKVE